MPTPLAVVQAQLDAYNARDIDAFAATFAPGVRVHDLDSGTLRFEGLDALQARYAEQFARNPRQRSAVVNRSVLGDYVFDLEFITGTEGRPDAHLMAIYRVRQGLIDACWFTPRI
jgi:putative hydrolase of HD superfamily